MVSGEMCGTVWPLGNWHMVLHCSSSQNKFRCVFESLNVLEIMHESDSKNSVR